MTVGFQLNCTGGYTDFSDYVDISTLKMSKSLDENNDPQKNITGEIECFGAAYTFIKANLIDSPNLYSNSICVQIVFTECSQTFNFKIETSDLKWCSGDECSIMMSLVEHNPTLDCIKNTIISDNTNGEFQMYPVSGMPHPRFRYCDVVKPTFFFGFIATFTNAIDAFIFSLNLVLMSFFTPLLNTINLFFGTNYQAPQIGYTSTALLGCNRMHPAPLVRTYINSPCALCGVTSTNATNPIILAAGSVYYNLCLLTAYTTKGVRDSGNMDYIVNNRPSWTLFDLMSKLKPIFNARFFLKNNNELHFNRKDLIGNQLWGAGPDIDLTTGGADEPYLLGKVCYSWNGQGKPSRINMNYSQDMSDNIGNELLCRFNGEFIPAANPNYTTPLEVVTPDFGAMSFVLDGKDTLYDAILEKAIGTVLSGSTFAGALKTQGDTLQLAKLILWDGVSVSDAKPVNDFWSPYSGLPGFLNDEGGFFPVTVGDLRNDNFPMSFDPGADAISSGNLWAFHWIDAPTSGTKTNIDFNFKLQMCCLYVSKEIYMSVLLPDGDTGEITSIDYDLDKMEMLVKGFVK